jgi:hypothetical protein
MATSTAIEKLLQATEEMPRARRSEHYHKTNAGLVVWYLVVGGTIVGSWWLVVYYYLRRFEVEGLRGDVSGIF